MKDKSLKKNYILNLIYQLLTIILPFITTPYVARVLQAEGSGAYGYTLANANFIGIFAIMGMDVYGQLQVAKYREDKIACSKILYGISFAKLFTTVITILVYFALEPKIGMYKNLYWIMVIFFLSQAVDFTWFFQGIEEFAFIVTRNVLVKIVGIVCVFAFVKVKEDVVIYAVIMQGTAFIGNLIVIPYLRKFVSLIPITQIHILPHIKGSMIYFIPTIATSVYTMLDKAMIGWVTKSSYENGYYEQAYKIVQIVLVVVTSLRTVTLPRVVHLYSEKNYKQVMEMVDGTIRFILLLSMPMSAGLIMVAPQLVPIFLGEGYEKCIIIVRILAVLIVVLGLSTLISGQCLTAMGKQKQANSCVIVGAAINFTMNLVLIPKCGALGAAIATVTAETIILAMFIVFGAEYIKLKEASKYFLEYLLCSLVMAVCIYGLRYTGLQNMGLFISQIAVGIVVYFAILLLIKDDMIMNFIHNIKHKKRLD